MFRIQGSLNSAQGPALNGVQVYICTQPANTGVNPPTPLASLFTDSTGSTPLANPVLTDGLGNWFAYAATGTYTVVYIDPNNRIPTLVFLDQQVVSPGGGSVTSVAIAVPTELTVSGSPISSSGTITIGKSNVNANLVLAGPSSGGAAPWAARALVAADLPAGVGTVSSVAVTVAGTALFSASVSGSPVTGSGTIAITLTLPNQNANTIFAGPASGSPATPTARTMVAADVVGLVPVSFSSTPVFDPTTFAFPTFAMTLTGNVASSTCPNGVPGQIATFVITQDGTGGRSFVYPSIFRGASNVEPTAGAVTVQSFVCISASLWRATGPGLMNGT